MPADKPRFLQNNRDMAISMIPLVLICIVVAAVAGQCSFSPGHPTKGQIPHYDATDALRADAQQLTFPIRLPRTPDGWQANSGGHDTVNGNDGGEATSVGYITPAGDYVRITQSNASAAALVRFVAGSARGVTGEQPVDGHQWSVYAQVGAEPIWTTDLGSVRMLLTGSGTDAEFRQLAAATTGEPPLPSQP